MIGLTTVWDKCHGKGKRSYCTCALHRGLPLKTTESQAQWYILLKPNKNPCTFLWTSGYIIETALGYNIFMPIFLKLRYVYFKIEKHVFNTEHRILDLNEWKRVKTTFSHDHPK